MNNRWSSAVLAGSLALTVMLAGCSGTNAQTYTAVPSTGEANDSGKDEITLYTIQ